MPVSSTTKTSHLSGLIERVDLVNRELDLVVEMRRIGVDVPPNCVVLLRGEPVKLRILQPGDHIQVAFNLRGGTRVAREIHVRGSQRV